MINPIKKVFFDFLDKTMSQKGTVISLRKWDLSAIYEIRVHLPNVDMQKWATVPRIKVKVAEFEYRDYSPACWDVAERTCCLFIDARHLGVGSSWVKCLVPGQTFLFAPASATALPSKKGPILCLADESALGHFLALKQLTAAEENPIEILISIDQHAVVPQEIIAANDGLQFIKRSHLDRLVNIHHSLSELNLPSFSSIYLAGHIPMVQGLRKILKANESVDARIIANGFWS